jgi:hypothetical protein
MKKETFYDILGLKQSATEADVKAAYRNLAKKYHPDVNHSADAAKKFKKGHNAYAILSDTNERKLYDDSLLSDKIPKDIFTQPKAEKATQTTYASPQVAEEEKHKQEAIRKYRKRLILKATIKIILNSLAGMTAGYVLITSLEMLELGSLKINWFSIFQFGGAVSGFMLLLIWSLDRYFKIETFIPKLKQRMFFRHFRTATFALAFTYLFAFIWSKFTNFNLEQKAYITEGVFGLLFLLSVTFASDGEMRNRFKNGKILEILIIFWHNFLIGLCGALLGGIVGSIFYLVQSEMAIIHIAITFGFIFALLIGSVASQDLDLIAKKITQVTQTFIYVILMLLAFVLGIGGGILIGKSLS